ncbi:hypothetical protein QUB63_33365 [Microcoleus sp. ARI1-B5]|uniref:hypothetical protein n=1 Tax=unclassified Microcoleus TaxID=2642155 RepID=UPI002FD3CA35
MKNSREVDRPARERQPIILARQQPLSRRVWLIYSSIVRTERPLQTVLRIGLSVLSSVAFSQ